MDFAFRETLLALEDELQALVAAGQPPPCGLPGPPTEGHRPEAECTADQGPRPEPGGQDRGWRKKERTGVGTESMCPINHRRLPSGKIPSPQNAAFCVSWKHLLKGVR